MKSTAALAHDLAPEVSFHPEVMGRFRRELGWTLGESRAHGVLARVGLSCGQSAAVENVDDPAIFHGLGEFRLLSSDNPAQVVYEVKNSREALEHLNFFHSENSFCQCWFLAGYLTGVISRKKGEPIYFLETQCLAKGDSACRFIGQSRFVWSSDGSADLSVYEEDNMALELQTTQRQLHLTKDRYQNLFEQSSVAIFIIDPQSGALLNANQSAVELTGRPKDELISMTLFDLCHPQEHHRVMTDLKSLLNGAAIVDKEISLVRRDGLIRIISHSSKVLTYGGQRVAHSVLRDITDLKLSGQKEKDLQNQLMRSERLSSIGRLAAGVAHELKNPLGAIRNAIYYVRNALTNNPILETDPHLKMILKLAEGEVDSSVVIIGDLLDFSRVVQLVPRHTQLNEVLEKLPNIVTVPENISLDWDLDVTLPTAVVDPDRLTQVFSNITTNAIQAMPQGGKLKIKSGFVVETAGEERTNQEYIVITFEDSGTGIDSVHLAKIFEPLFTTKARGTGLGLAISRNIVEKHGGQILVTSQVGKGTSFNVKLPLRVPADKEEKS